MGLGGLGLGLAWYARDTQGEAMPHTWPLLRVGHPERRRCDTILDKRSTYLVTYLSAPFRADTCADLGSELHKVLVSNPPYP